MASEGRAVIRTAIDMGQTPPSFISNRPSGSGKTRIGHSVRRLVAAKDIPKESSGPSKKFVLLEHDPKDTLLVIIIQIKTIKIRRVPYLTSVRKSCRSISFTLTHGPMQNNS